MTNCICGPGWRNPNCDLHGNARQECVQAKPYYRRAADLSEFMEIMGEHGEAAMCDLLDAVLHGTASPRFVEQAEAKLAEWNAGIDEREAEEAKPVIGADEAAVQDIAAWALPGASDEVHEALRIAARNGIARGRALGARDENAACEKIARVRSQSADKALIELRKRRAPHDHGLGDRESEASIIADAIARRAGRGT